MKYKYIVEIKNYTADGYRNTETVENGSCDETFRAADWLNEWDFSDVDYFGLRAVECTITFWLSGADPAFNDPAFTDSCDMYF